MNRKMLRSIVIGIISNLLLLSWCSAASFYIRKGATGANNGSDWTNAWNQTSQVNYSVLSPGDTVYIAAGTYGALNVNKSGTAGNPITFKRATAAGHGSDTGWSGSHDGQVIIDGGIEIGTTINANYITIDGVTKYGIWARNGQRGIGTRNGGRADNLTLRYIESGGTGTFANNEDGIQGVGNNLLVEYCYVHDNDSTVTHGDGIQWFQGDGVIIRYSVFKNNGQQTMLGEAAWSVYANDVQIYYNIFYNRGGTHYNGITAHTGSPQAGRFFRIYNNTFDLEATDNSGYNNIFNLASPIGPVEFKNNAVIHSNAASVGQASHSFNGFDNAGEYSVYNIPSETGRVVAADLGFVNVASADYHLTSSSPLIGKGVNVGLTKDFDGKPVSATLSIGAFESASGGPVTLIPPANLRVAP